MPKGNLDIGAAVGSYIGLFFLGAVFASIGIFASSLTKNQIVAFIMGLFFCAFAYDAFSSLSRLPIFFGGADSIVEYLGINFHYSSVSKGLVDTRDILYFVSIIAIFLFATKTALEKRKW